MPDHSPTPWKINERFAGLICDANGNVILDCKSSAEDDAFLLKAVNHHDTLVVALREIAEDTGPCAKPYFSNTATCLQFSQFVAATPDSVPPEFRASIIAGKDWCATCRARAALALVDGGKEEQSNV